jgi:hypothetical protein
MDPNETLKQLRDAMARLSDYQTGPFPRPSLDDAVDDAIEMFASLDLWLSNGGAKPDVWSWPEVGPAT